MNILYVTPYYAPAYAFGGVVRAVEGMAHALVRRGHNITVLTTDALDQKTRYTGALHEMLDGVHVVRVRNISIGLRGRANLSTPNGMRPIAQALVPDADVIHCHEFRTTENLLVTPLAAEQHKPLVLSPHGTMTLDTGRSRLKSGWDQLFSPALAQRFDQVVCLTENEAEAVQDIWKAFGPRRIPTEFSVIPNGIDLAAYTDLPGRDDFRAKYTLGDHPVCLFMGRLHARKGVDILIQAFRQANLPDARLVIAGPDEGMLDTLRTLADERVIFTGFLDGAERLAAFAAADLLALPATGEGLSMAVLEAMGTGLPVILSPGCNLPEAALSGAGLEVEPQVEPLSTALYALLTSRQRRLSMGTAARELVANRFTWDALAERQESVYQQLCTRKTARKSRKKSKD